MLTTNQIEALLKGTRLFIGVYACDELPVVTQRPVTMIANTDPASEPGEHWVAIHLKEDGTGEFFCPFGFPPLVPAIQSFLSRYATAGLQYNNCTMQDVTSTMCGDYCVCFVRCVARGLHLSQFVTRFRNQALGKNNNRIMLCD